MSLTSDAALIVIDVQQGMDDPRGGERNNPDAEKRIADLLAAWRGARRPVIHVQHSSLAGRWFHRGRASHARRPMRCTSGSVFRRSTCGLKESRFPIYA